MEFENEVIAYLKEKNGRVRSETLVNDLIDRHTNENEEGEDKVDIGYSRAVIFRKIKQLVNNKIILSLDYNELMKYGFSEIDRRSVYLILPEKLKLKLHFDKVLKFLESKDSEVQKMAIREVQRYESKYQFDENQLDILVKILNKNDDDLVDYILKVILKYVTEKGRVPSDKLEIIVALKSLLQRYPVFLNKYPKLRMHVIYLLGYFNDEAVIDQLKKDANSLDDPLLVRIDYFSEYTASVIEDHKTDLFDFELKLRNNKKGEAANFVSEIRDNAICLLTEDKKTKKLYEPLRRFENEIDNIKRSRH